MSPLKISLLLRCYCQLIPNQDLPREQALAPAMLQAVEDFRVEGILKNFASPHVLRFGAIPCGGRVLTYKGLRLALRIISAAEDFYKEAT